MTWMMWRHPHVRKHLNVNWVKPWDQGDWENGFLDVWLVGCHMGWLRCWLVQPAHRKLYLDTCNSGSSVGCLSCWTWAKSGTFHAYRVTIHLHAPCIYLYKYILCIYIYITNIVLAHINTVLHKHTIKPYIIYEYICLIINNISINTRNVTISYLSPSPSQRSS